MPRTPSKARPPRKTSSQPEAATKTTTPGAAIGRGRTRAETFESRFARLPTDAAPPLLQLVQAKPNQPVPPEVLKAAEAAFKRVAAELKAGAADLPLPQELEDIVAASDA